MNLKVFFIIGLPVLLLAAASCLTAQTPKDDAETGTDPDGDAAEVLVTFGDKKLTMQHAIWIRPSASKKEIAEFANSWLETQLLYEEAQRRGMTEEPRTVFIAELRRQNTYASELKARLRNAVKSEISDKTIRDFYEKNKDTDRTLQQKSSMSFSHIRTRKLEDAQAALERIKAGENINTLAKQLSVYGDAQAGGFIKDYSYEAVKIRFGIEFFDKLVTAKKGKIIGPIEIRKGTYEIARLDNKTDPAAVPFEKVRGSIRHRLSNAEKRRAVDSLLASLKEKAADRIVLSSRVDQAGKSKNQKSQKVGPEPEPAPKK